MSDLDLQFEEFMKEPLSTDESPETNSSSKKTNAKDKLPEPRTFWWMKSKPPAEPVSHRSSLSSTSIDEKLESPQLDRGSVPVSPSQQPANKRGSASPEISSSMAEFLEKENLCKELSSSISEVESPGIDLDDVTDDDIGSIMEQLSQLAGSGDDSAADKSVEEILKEAEDLVRETSHSFSALSEGRDILTVPITPDLVLRGQPSSRKSPSKKNSSPRSGERSRDDRSSSSRSSSAPPTSRKSHRSGKVKGGRMTGTTSAYAISRNTENRTSPPEGLRRSLSDTRKDADDFLGNVFSAADLLNSNIDLSSHYSGESSRVKDTPRKEKTVTFNENFISPEILDNSSSSNKVPHTQASSQLRKENQKTLSKQLSDSEMLLKENDSLREIKTAEVSSRKRKLTELVSISPPLIQHGDVVGTPEAIFQLIDDEVRDEIVAALKESSKETSQHHPLNPSVTIEEEMNKIFDHNENASSTASSCVEGLDSSRKQPLSIVLEESSVSDVSCEVDKTKDISIVSEEVARIETSDKSIQVTDNTSKKQIENLEKELLQEKSKIMQYKAEISIEEQEHKKQIDVLKCKHEEEMFKLKKELFVLNAKITDMEKHHNEGRREDDAAKEHRIALLEAELQQQEQLMLGYQRENVRLCQDMKHLREVMTVKEKNFVEERQQLAVAKPNHEVERLIDRLKDKDELIVRLQIEIQAYKDKYTKLEHTTEELELSNKTLKSDLEKYKLASSKIASTPVKTTPRNQDLERFKEELVRRELEVDNIRRDLHVTQSELVTAKATVSEYQLQIGELEFKVSELQSALNKERSQNRVQIQKSEDDKKKIQDLNRQVKEMERILKRHHPNSISALILTANSESTDSTSGQTPRVKFLENRVQQLEQELAKSETESQDKIKEIQNKFQEMKVKYEEHTSDLELQLATAKHQSHMWRQAAERNETRDNKAEEHPVRETKLVKKVLQPPMVITVGAPPPNALAVREDAHLLATIRGLKQELATKDKELVKIRRDLDESFKTNRRLQRERERQLGIVAAPPRPPAVRGVPRDEQSGEMSQKLSPNENETVSPEQKENLSKLEEENGKLHQELVRLEEEYRILQTKRLEDLNLLQEEHEAEIDHLISGQMARNSSAHVADLQGQLCAQQVLIDQFKQQLRRTDEYREELELMRVERVHLEKNNMELHKKLADLRALMTPEMLQYEALQEKLSELERRHEVREQKLQAMVKDLLRRNAEQRAQSGDDESATTMREKLLDKNRQLCLYRAEIDRILDTLKEFNRYKKPSNAVK